MYSEVLPFHRRGVQAQRNRRIWFRTGISVYCPVHGYKEILGTARNQLNSPQFKPSSARAGTSSSPRAWLWAVLDPWPGGWTWSDWQEAGSFVLVWCFKETILKLPGKLLFITLSLQTVRFVAEDKLTPTGDGAVDGPSVHTNTHFSFKSLLSLWINSTEMVFYFQPQFIDFVSLVVPSLGVHLVHTNYCFVLPCEVELDQNNILCHLHVTFQQHYSLQWHFLKGEIAWAQFFLE